MMFGLFEDKVDEARLRVKAQMVNQPLDLVPDVFVKQSKRAHAHSHKEQGLRQLEGCDQNEPRIVPPMGRIKLSGRVVCHLAECAQHSCLPLR